MGFVIGPILRKVGLSVRREIIIRLVPRTLFDADTLDHHRNHWLVSR